MPIMRSNFFSIHVSLCTVLSNFTFRILRPGRTLAHCEAGRAGFPLQPVAKGF